jgi:hypothetical protein
MYGTKECIARSQKIHFYRPKVNIQDLMQADATFLLSMHKYSRSFLLAYIGKMAACKFTFVCLAPFR